MAAIRVVDRIQDMADFAGSLTDKDILQYNGGTGKFTLSVFNFVFNQLIASSTWSIAHNLNRFPSVSVVDSAGDLVEGDVQYVDSNHITISFSAPFGGTAYLT